mmetsp:Transcript_19697/g.47802  ORF Transcript_19697/g.47802 Transcript_19697/m.47802 type:complete len:217 (-) Transcript_19697:62-712(-)
MRPLQRRSSGCIPMVCRPMVSVNDGRVYAWAEGATVRLMHHWRSAFPLNDAAGPLWETSVSYFVGPGPAGPVTCDMLRSAGNSWPGPPNRTPGGEGRRLASAAVTSPTEALAVGFSTRSGIRPRNVAEGALGPPIVVAECAAAQSYAPGPRPVSVALEAGSPTSKAPVERGVPLAVDPTLWAPGPGDSCWSLGVVNRGDFGNRAAGLPSPKPPRTL